MNEMRNILEEFLENSTPEQLRAELNKGNRPFFQTLTNSDLVCFTPAQALPECIPATVSFFMGDFVEDEPADEVWDRRFIADRAYEELALAA